MAVAAVILANDPRGSAALSTTCYDTSDIDARLKTYRAQAEKVKEMKDIIKRYDKDKSGNLQKSEIKRLLTDLNLSTPKGTPPSEEELNFIMALGDTKCKNGAIDLSELEHVITTWLVYVEKREDMEKVLKRYDKSGNGKLERDELRAYLNHLNGEKPVTDEEVDLVLSQADVFEDGAINLPELVRATSIWFANVKEKKAKSRACEIL
eukprot:TRINITY_DN895_c0_g1_i1.p1 TRINITY_DN895_c0_g1~~TRINITY_DN895_c0_g1_i1.p1  ORF type:complete len:232 (-),score=38.35 TRINITY_DN895_c0_g1_i1:104-727(-)